MLDTFSRAQLVHAVRGSLTVEKGVEIPKVLFPLSLSHPVPHLSTLLQKEKEIQNDSDSFFLEFNV